MDLTPFVSTCRSIVEEWETKPPADLYRPLISALNEVLETPGGAASEKVRKERARITKHHEDFELAGTSGPYGRKVLNALGVEKVLGPGANEEIARVFAANQADPAAAAAGLEELLRAAEAAQHRLAQLKDGFGAFWEQAGDSATDELEDRVTVIFDRTVSAPSDGDLEDTITQWVKNLGAFARLSTNPCEDLRFLAADRQSLHLEIQTDCYTATVLSSCIERVLTIRRRLLDITRAVIGIRLLSLPDNKVEKLLAEQQEVERESLIDDIAEAVVEAFPAETNSDVDQTDSYIKAVAIRGSELAIKTAVRDIYAFVEEGGEIDVVLPAESAAEELRPICGGLRKGFSDLRALQDELRALEAGRNLATSVADERPPAKAPLRNTPQPARQGDSETANGALNAVRG